MAIGYKIFTAMFLCVSTKLETDQRIKIVIANTKNMMML